MIFIEYRHREKTCFCFEKYVSTDMMVGGCAFSSARTDDGTEVLWHDPSMSSVNAERTFFIIPGIIFWAIV